MPDYEIYVDDSYLIELAKVNPYLAALEWEANQPIPFQSLAEAHHWDEVVRPTPPKGLYHPTSMTDGQPDCYWSGIYAHGMYLDADGKPVRSWCGQLKTIKYPEDAFLCPLPAWFGSDICKVCLRVAHSAWKQQCGVGY